MGKSIKEQISTLRPYIKSNEKIGYLPHNFNKIDLSNTDKTQINFAGIEFISTEKIKKDLENVIEKLNADPNLPAYMNIVALNEIQNKKMPQFRYHGMIIVKDTIHKDEIEYSKATSQYIQKLRKEIKDYVRNGCLKKKKN